MSDRFTSETFEFLWGIRLNNERPWFEAHKTQYRDAVEEPLRALARQVHQEMTARYPGELLNLKVSRIYRDARRLHGRGPYKDHMWFILRRAEDPEVDLPCFYFELAPEYYSYGLGYYEARPVTMAKLRARLDAAPAPAEKLARRLNRQKEFVLGGECYARPKGDPGPLLEPWYNARNISFSRDRAPDGDVFAPDLAARVVEGFRWLMPFYRYLVTLPTDPDPRT